MIHSLAGALAAFAAFVLASHLLQRLWTHFTSSRRARQLGCRPPPAWPLPWWDVLGVTMLRSALSSSKEGRVMEWFVNRHDVMQKHAGRPVHTYSLKNLGEPFVFTIDPRNVQAVLATQFKDFGISETRQGAFAPLLLNGIFVANGTKWEHSRAMLRPSFARDRVSDLDMERRHNANLVGAIDMHEHGWTVAVDLQPLFFRLTIDSSTEFLFGASVNSQLTESRRAHGVPVSTGKGISEIDFTAAFDFSQSFLADRARLGRAYWLGRSAAFDRANKTCHEFIDHYVRLALDKLRSGKKEQPAAGKEQYIFLDELVQQTQDPIEIRSQLINILLAGRDTTASLLGYLFTLLAQNPQVFQKLRRTILEEFGPADAQGTISFASLKGCKYLQNCINETLRLYPVVPANGRSALRDTTIPVGGGPDGNSPVFIPKGSTVNYSVYVMHRDPSVWGDPLVFRPERWQDVRQSFNYLPFNAGPRICLGQQFALTSASFTTVYLLQRFDAIDYVGAENISQAVSLTSRPADGVKVRLHKA